MYQQTLQHGFTTGHHLWLCLAVALGLALGSQAAAKECHRKTPLPTDVRLTVPGLEVPEAVARFAGAWSGAWVDQEGRETQCHMLAGYGRSLAMGGCPGPPFPSC